MCASSAEAHTGPVLTRSDTHQSPARQGILGHRWLRRSAAAPLREPDGDSRNLSLWWARRLWRSNRSRSERPNRSLGTSSLSRAERPCLPTEAKPRTARGLLHRGPTAPADSLGWCAPASGTTCYSEPVQRRGPRGASLRARTRQRLQGEDAGSSPSCGYTREPTQHLGDR